MRIMLNGWETGIRFVAGHFLPSIEKCSRLHGHNYAVLIEIEGEPGPDGIIIDFISVKEAAHAIVQRIDHRMILPSSGASMEVALKEGHYAVSFNGKNYLFPSGDVAVIPVDNVSAENLSRYFLAEIVRSGIFGDNVTRVAVGVAEGRGQEAWSEEMLK